MPLPLLALAIASFGIGTSEFIIMGLLPDVARDLVVTIPTAGLLVTGYAIAVTLGAPILAILTARLPPRWTLFAMVVIFAIGNLGCALAPNYGFLMAARIVTALSHGTFFGVGAVVAAGLVPRHKRASAIALMFAGLTLANVLGVPLGTALGQALGWRAPFFGVIAIAILALIAMFLWLPRTIANSGGNILDEFKVLTRPQVLLAMSMSVLASMSLFSVFTYITPLLEHVSGASPAAVTWILLLFGVGLTLGNVLGGRLADWRLMPSLQLLLGLVTLALGLLTLTAGNLPMAAATIFVWGILAFALVSPMQLRIVDKAAEAPNLASTLNQGAFNLGNATGAWLGGAAITAGVTYDHLPWIGAVVALLALLVTAFAAHSDRGAASGPHGEAPCQTA
ncbi:MFS transporter [Arboricoccus pini]|uniref:MFS transporter n=1 Tax=Arboricoccus pini TaxID=1963835 RepID=UPI000B511C0B|nr:MFS transporter [Arboricoccus pini]